MYVCDVRHAHKIAKLFFSVRSTQFPFKLTKKYINLLGPKTLRWKLFQRTQDLRDMHEITDRSARK